MTTSTDTSKINPPPPCPDRWVGSLRLTRWLVLSASAYRQGRHQIAHMRPLELETRPGTIPLLADAEVLRAVMLHFQGRDPAAYEVHGVYDCDKMSFRTDYTLKGLRVWLRDPAARERFEATFLPIADYAPGAAIH